MVQTTNDLLGKTRDGYLVYDRVDSHLHEEGGLTRKIIQEALSYMYANNANFKVKTVCFKKQIGFNHCVSVEEDDDVVMVYRKGRQGPTPMVKNRKAEPSKEVTLILKKETSLENHYTLITAFIGPEASKEPWDKSLREGSKEKERSIAFWKTHALIYDEKLIDHLA